MADTAPDIITALLHYKAQLEPHYKALWAMTPQERVVAMRRGELNMLQLYEWAFPRPTRGTAAGRRVRVHRDHDARGRRPRRALTHTTACGGARARRRLALTAPAHPAGPLP